MDKIPIVFKTVDINSGEVETVATISLVASKKHYRVYDGLNEYETKKQVQSYLAKHLYSLYHGLSSHLLDSLQRDIEHIFRKQYVSISTISEIDSIFRNLKETLNVGFEIQEV